MAEKDLLLKEKLIHTGIFDLGSFYNFAHKWFIDEKYGVDEDRYSEKISGDSRDLSFEWKAHKKLSDYFKAEQKLKFKISNVRDVEVEIDGVKKQMQKGDIELEINGNLISDPDSKWEKSPFYRMLRDIYGKYIIPGRTDLIKDRVKDDLRAFKDEIKGFLDLEGKR